MILVLKIASACALLFVSVFFVLQHWDSAYMYRFSDMAKWPDDPIGQTGRYVPVNMTSAVFDFAFLGIFGIGILFVCFYIGYQVSRIEDKNYHRSERFDLIYKIVFTCLVLYIAIRAIFVEPFIGVPTIALGLAVTVGFINWFIPPIITYDDDTF